MRDQEADARKPRPQPPAAAQPPQRPAAAPAQIPTGKPPAAAPPGGAPGAAGAATTRPAPAAQLHRQPVQAAIAAPLQGAMPAPKQAAPADVRPSSTASEQFESYDISPYRWACTPPGAWLPAAAHAKHPAGCMCPQMGTLSSTRDTCCYCKILCQRWTYFMQGGV